MDRERRKLKKQLAKQVHSPFTAKRGKAWKTGLIVLAVILGIGGLTVAAAMLGWISIPGLTPAPTQPAETTPIETVPDTVIHFVAGGDLNVTDKTVNSGLHAGGYDYTNIFLDLVPVLSGSDLTALNFEGNLCGEPYGTQYASAPQQLAQALREAGVDILQTANSQTITNGPLGLTSTLNGIQAAGMTPLGTYASAAEFKKSGGYIIREVQGIRIAFVAFTKGMDGRGLPAVSENCVNLLYKDYISYQTVDEEGITAILRAAQAQKPDVTIAMLHWGSNLNDQISSSQEKIAKLMLEEGVDAIVGTHSHRVQKMTFDAEKGQFIAYSLGDFFGDAKSNTDTSYSVLLDLQITKDGMTGETKITGFDYTPIFTSYEDTGARVLRIREAMAAFESNSIGRVSQETYDAMSDALKRIEKRVNG